MPKIQFANLPRELWTHILNRVNERQISLKDLQRLQDWAQSEPQAPEGNWYKDFGSFKLCGTAEFPKTILTEKMKPFGEEIE